MVSSPVMRILRCSTRAVSMAETGSGRDVTTGATGLAGLIIALAVVESTTIAGTATTTLRATTVNRRRPFERRATLPTVRFIRATFD